MLNTLSGGLLHKTWIRFKSCWSEGFSVGWKFILMLYHHVLFPLRKIRLFCDVTTSWRTWAYLLWQKISHFTTYKTKQITEHWPLDLIQITAYLTRFYNLSVVFRISLQWFITHVRNNVFLLTMHAFVFQDPVYGKGKLTEIQGLILGMLDTFNYEQVTNRGICCSIRSKSSQN